MHDTMTQITNPLRSAAGNDEIDLLVLAKRLWKKRITIGKCILAGATLSLLIALLSPNKYTVTATIVPPAEQDKLAGLGGISSIASMAGIDLKNMTSAEALSPLVYPSLIRSFPFQIELMNTPFSCPGFDKPVSLAEYLIRDREKGIVPAIWRYTIGLPRRLSTKTEKEPLSIRFGDKQLQSVTRDQEDVREKLKKIIRLEQNEEEGYLELRVILKDPVLTAQVAQKALMMLQDYITRFKIEKATQKLLFTEARYNEKKAEFAQAQRNLAVFRNRSKSMSTAALQTELEQLQSTYQIAYSVYTELAKQLEQAQIEVKEDTPVLTVIDPVHIPTKKSAPKNFLILLLGIFLGTLAGIGLVVCREYATGLKEQWKKL